MLFNYFTFSITLLSDHGSVNLTQNVHYYLLNKPTILNVDLFKFIKKIFSLPCIVLRNQ